MLGAGGQRLDLLALERDLLLLAVDRQLARVRRFAGLGRARFGLDELDAHAAQTTISTSATRAAAADSRSRASASRARADSMVSASCRYLRANSTFSQRRISSRSFW